MVISSMGIRVDMVPLGHKHPCTIELTPCIILLTLTLDKTAGYSEHLVSSSTLSFLNGNITNNTFFAYVVITPEWSNYIRIPSVQVVSWKTTGMGKLPLGIEGNDTIFTYLGKKQICTKVDSIVSTPMPNGFVIKPLLLRNKYECSYSLLLPMS